MKTNNNNKKAIFFIVISLSLLTTALTSITYLSSATTVFAVQGGEGDKQKFTAHLFGDQQVPPVQLMHQVWYGLNQCKIMSGLILLSLIYKV